MDKKNPTVLQTAKQDRGGRELIATKKPLLLSYSCANQVIYKATKDEREKNFFLLQSTQGANILQYTQPTTVPSVSILGQSFIQQLP